MNILYYVFGSTQQHIDDYIQYKPQPHSNNALRLVYLSEKGSFQQLKFNNLSVIY